MAKFPESVVAVAAQLERYIPEHRVPPLGPRRLSIGDPEEIRSIGDAFLGDPLPPSYDTEYYRPTGDLVGWYRGFGLLTPFALLQVNKVGNAKAVDDSLDVLFKVSAASGLARRKFEWFYDPHKEYVSEKNVAAMALLGLHGAKRPDDRLLRRQWDFRIRAAGTYELEHPYHERLNAQADELFARAIQAEVARAREISRNRAED